MKRYKKRTYKKRPYAKRRSSTRRTYRRAMRPDGGYKEKITKVIPIYSDPNDLNAGILDDEHQYFNINWYDDGAAATDRYTNYNSGQHQQQVLNFLYYKPYLMTYKYTPRNVAPTGGNDTALIQSIQVASFRPTTQAASTEAEEKEQLQQKMDFKLYTANGGHRRSYKTGRFLAKQKLPWIPTDTPFVFARELKMNTEIMFTGQGLRGPDEENPTRQYLGTITVNYYVKYKSRRPAAIV